MVLACVHTPGLPASWDLPVLGLQPQKSKLHWSGAQADVGDFWKPPAHPQMRSSLGPTAPESAG